ncbi:exporter of polyketide antibiotics [Gordonia sinesedis]
MTAVAASAYAVGSTADRGGYFTHTGLLVRLMVRRERWFALVTLVVFLAVNVATAASISASYGTPAGRASLQNGPASNAAFRFLLGPLTSLESTAALTVWRAGLFMIAALAVCAVVMVVRETRKDEDLGRVELVRAGATGPLAIPTAAAVVASGFCVIVALGMSSMLIPLGATASGVAGVFAQYAASGFAAVGIALVAAQVAQTSQIAMMLGATVVLVGYLLRGVADATGDLSWLRWVSPVGWAEMIDPFGTGSLVPAFASLTVGAVAMVIAGRLAVRRDLGAGLIEPRPGPAGSSRLGSVGLVVGRLDAGLLASWAAGIGVYGLVVGFLRPSVDDLADGNRQVTDVLRQAGPAGDLTTLFGMTMLSFLAVATSAWAVNLAERMRAEEAAGRAEALLATPVSRTRFLGAYYAVAAAGIVLTLAVAAVAMTVGSGIAGGDWASSAHDDAVAAASQLPATLVVGLLAITLYAARPSLAHAGWLPVIGALLLGPLAGMFGLPQWARDLSPFTHTPPVPVEPMRWLPVGVMGVVAAAVVIVGVALFRRRDVG